MSLNWPLTTAVPLNSGAGFWIAGTGMMIRISAINNHIRYNMEYPRCRFAACLPMKKKEVIAVYIEEEIGKPIWMLMSAVNKWWKIQNNNATVPHSSNVRSNHASVRQKMTHAHTMKHVLVYHSSIGRLSHHYTRVQHTMSANDLRRAHSSRRTV